MAKEKDPKKTTVKNKGKRPAGQEERQPPKTAQTEQKEEVREKERPAEKQNVQKSAVSEERPKERPQQERERREEKKAVDEDWKGQVQKEKGQEQVKEQTTKEEVHPPIPEANFILFVSGFATQTLIALGQLENPMTKKREANLDQARYTIDTLKMIQEKTKGNLTPEEEKYLEGVLYDLRMSYVASVK